MGKPLFNSKSIGSAAVLGAFVFAGLAATSAMGQETAGGQEPELSVVRIKVEPTTVDLGIPQIPPPTISAEITVGEASTESQIQETKRLLDQEVQSLPDDLRKTLQVVRVVDPNQASSPQVDAVAAAIPAASRVQLPPPPWYANARLRKLVFASMRVVVNGTGTAVIYLSEKGYPLEMSLAGAGLAAVMSGLLQYYSVPLVKNYLDHPFLNRAVGLPSRQHPQPEASPFKQWLGRSIQGAEFWVKWYGLEVGFIGLTAGTLVGVASWMGVDMGPEFDSWKTILGKALETAAYSMAGQGAWDRFIINRLNRWTERMPPGLPGHAAERGVMVAEASFAFNSMVSVVLALTSMTGAEFAVTGLYAYAGSGLVALAYDGIKSTAKKIASSVRSFFGLRTGCERALERQKKNDLSVWQPRFFLSSTARVC